PLRGHRDTWGRTVRGGRRKRAHEVVREPRCARRPARGAQGRADANTDRRHLGSRDIRTSLCLAPPRGRRRCSRLDLPPAVYVTTRVTRPDISGDWRVTLRASGRITATTVAVNAK